MTRADASNKNNNKNGQKPKKEKRNKKMKNKIVASAIEEKVARANEELEELTKGGFPFSFEDVKLSLETSPAGLVIRSGSDLVSVCRWPKRFDTSSEKACIADLQGEINEAVRQISQAVENRGGLVKAEDDLQAENAEESKALEILLNGGISREDAEKLLSISAPACADGCFEAAEKAVKAANRMLTMVIIGSGRSYAKERMTLRRYKGGFSLRAGGKTIMVTRWPKDQRRIDSMVRYVTETISACAESRCGYFRRQRDLRDMEDRLSEMSEKVSEAEKIAAGM